MKMRLLSTEETKELIRKENTTLVDRVEDSQKFEKSLESILIPNEDFYLHGIVEFGTDYIVIYSSHGSRFAWQTDDLSNDSTGFNDEIFEGDLQKEFGVPMAIEKRIFRKGEK